MKRDVQVGKFRSFIQVQNRTAEGLASSTLIQELTRYKLGRNLIAQTYGGATVFSGGGGYEVKVKIKYTFSHVHFILCFVHQLILEMMEVCSTVK